jgi:uncharacterized protein (TIGR00255 family)
MKSMTGMGRAQGTVQGAGVRIEIKSINHRFCEVGAKLPGRFLPLEILIQQAVKKTLSRGKIDVFVSEEKNQKLSVAENEAYRACYAHLKGVRDGLGLEGGVTLQDVMAHVNAWVQRDLDVESAWEEFRPILDAALSDLVSMRQKEGLNLKKQMQELFAALQVILARIEAQRSGIQAELEKRLREKIAQKAEELGGVDPLRLQMEVLFYLDRTDVTEELQRLKSHFKQAEAFFADPAPSGRKLDFLLQEFNREFNTIGSKIQSGDVAHLVVDAKAELEKIREQIQNIE